MNATLTKVKSGKGTFARGIHPPERKTLAQDAAVEALATPQQVVLPLLQHLGAPCESLVAPKQEVAMGQMVAKATGFVSAPIHASVKGVVGAGGVTTLPNGRHVKTVVIAAAPEQPLAGRALWDDVYGGDWPLRQLPRLEPGQIVQAIQDAGLVGMGGAAFPTHVKLTRNEKRPVDTLLVNGCECEPYLTADYRLMVEAPRPIVAGAILAARAAGARDIQVAIEDNKPAAVEALREAVEGTGVQVRVLKTKYPQGGERQVVPAVLGREVPTGGLPLDVGVVVMNVATAAAVARALLRGKPLTHRIVSVTGGGIRTPRNLLAPIGASYQSLIDACGGLTDDAARVISGGPIMGFALGELDVPVTKGTSGVTVLTHEEVRRSAETPCVRCGRCVEVCPLDLVPTRIALAARNKDWDLARRYHMQACCECGCCGYICPARVPLVQLIRMGKVQMGKE
jgi:electron transport complex protein RnfC